MDKTAKVLKFPGGKKVPQWKRIFDYVQSRGRIGATAEEVERATSIRGNSVSTALSQLRKQRLIKKNGKMRLTSAGTRATVYIINPRRPK